MKVPIEVILQDPTQPIPPTPDPTPITPVVPNTGAETMQTVADVTNGVSVGLVIIASLIFAVAIGALMLYLFHLYNHQKAVIEQHEEKNKEKHNKTNDAAEDQNPFGSNKEQKAESVLTKTIKEHNTKKAKAHKWSKGLFIASGATAVLAFAAFMGSFIFYSMIQPNSSSALEPTELNDSTYVTNNGTITITANLYNNEPVITGIKDTALVTTDATKGYELYLSMSDNSLDNKLYLDGDTTSEYYITPTSGQLNITDPTNPANSDNLGTSSALELNTWGINLDGSDNYAALPTIGSKLLIKTADTAVTEDPVDIYYSVKVDKSLPYGTYKGEIEYDAEPILAKDLSSISTMQEMTAEIRDNTPTPAAFKEDGVTINDDVPTATLTDTRDGKTYTVAKLADGKVWMTQNLDLQKEDLLPDVALTNENTNNPAEGFELPYSQTSGDGSWGSDETAVNTARVFDLLDNTYNKCIRFQPGPGICLEYSEDYWGSRELGNYYNWHTATAGTGTYNTGSGEDATGSICPKGWRLPVVVMEQYRGYPYNAEVKDFSELMKDYGVIYNITGDGSGGDLHFDYDQNSVNRAYSNPINVTISGYYDSSVVRIGYDGNIWSSRKSSNGINYQRFYLDSIHPWYGGAPNLNYGYSVRCVAE